MRASALVAATIVLGCGSGGGDGDEARSRLRIEMRPVSAVAFTSVFELDDAQVLRATDVVPFAWGGDYPSALEIGIDVAYSTCGPLTGTFVLDEVESLDAALDVELGEAGAFRLAPTTEGDFAAVVRGTFVADPEVESCAGAQAPVEIHLSVPVRRPVGVEISAPELCRDGDAFRVETDGRLAAGLFLQLVDSDGVAFRPRNAAATHPATLELVADDDTALSLHTPDEGLAALVVSGAPGIVSVRAFDEEQHAIEHVAPADIDVVGVAFALQGNAGGPTPLESGQTYGEGGWARTTASIGIVSFGMEVDGAQICTLPSVEGFVLESSTPQNCVAIEAPGHGVGPYGESVFDPLLPVSGEVVASGACTLELRGPSYSEGAGFSTVLAVEILSAESLAHFEGR